MNSGWYIKFSDDHIEGPLSAAALKGRALRGHVIPETMVRLGTNRNWVAASRVKGLFDSEVKEADVFTDKEQPKTSFPDHGWNDEDNHKAPQATSAPLEPVSNANQSSTSAESSSQPTTTVSEEGSQATDSSSSRLVSCYDCGKSISRFASACPNCGRPVVEPTLSSLVSCDDCCKSISRFASVCPNCGCPVVEPSRADKYPALRGISVINMCFAVIIPFVCLVALVAVAGTDDIEAKPQIIISLVVYMILSPIFLYGAGELILLLIGIEKNTSSLRGITFAERKEREISHQEADKHFREEKIKKQIKYDKAKPKLSSDLWEIISHTGYQVPVCIDLSILARTQSFIQNNQQLSLIDKRPWKEREYGVTKRITCHINVEHVADLALLSEVERVSRWHC